MLVLVIDGSIDDSVSDSLGHYALGVLDGLESEFLGDVVEGDFGVGEVDLFEAEFDDVVTKAVDEVVVAVFEEKVFVVRDDLFELIEGAFSDFLDDLEVGVEVFSEFGFSENCFVWNFSHQ